MKNFETFLGKYLQSHLSSVKLQYFPLSFETFFSTAISCEQFLLKDTKACSKVNNNQIRTFGQILFKLLVTYSVISNLIY